MGRTDAQPDEIKEAQEMLKELHAEKLNPYENRESKVAEFRMKKIIS